MSVSLPALLRPRMGLTAWLVTVSVLAWAPMLVLASILAYQQQVEHQARGQAALARSAQAAATSVGHLLDSTLVELRSLARVDHIIAATWRPCTRMRVESCRSKAGSGRSA